MPVGIPVPCRIHFGSIFCIDHPIKITSRRILLYVVVQRIYHFARINTAGVIPEESIINGWCLNPRLHEVISPTQKPQLFFQQGRHLTFKRKHRRSNIPVAFVIGSYANRRICCVSQSFISQHHVEIVQITSS